MAAFVGRTKELQQLGQALDAALAGRGGVFFVKGDAGAGKSSLIARFLVEAATRAPELRILSGECSEQFGAEEAYQPFIEAFRALVQEPAQARPEKRRLRDLARQIAPFWLQVIPVAGDIIAATAATATELRRGWGGTRTAEAPTEETLFYQYTELLFAVAAEQPVLLFIDDLHWADRASVALLAHLGRRITDQRVLILGTYRETDVVVSEHPIRQARLELERYRAAREMALEPLDPAALGDLVREELGAPATPELLRWLQQRAGSTPLFFGELLRWLLEQGLVENRRGEWALLRVPEEIEIPRTAESIIEKRLARLDPELSKIVEYASVFGADFDSVSLSRLLAMDELELEERLDGIARTHQLIRLDDTRELPSGDFASIYEFSHSLIQQALHRSVQGKRRILLHRKLAEILEATYAGQTAAIAHRLAAHFDEGRLGERAYACALEAADAASRFYAPWSVLDVLRRALRNAQTDAQRLEALDRMGESNRLLGRYGEALAYFTEALELAESGGDRERGIGLRRKMILVERDHGARKPTDLVIQLRRLEAEARDIEAREELCALLWLYRRFPGGTLRDTNVDVRQKAEEARTIAEALADPAMVARADYEVGMTRIYGAPADAILRFAAAAEAFERLGDRDRLGMCQNGIGIARMLLGDYRAAAESLARAAEIFDDLGDPVNEAAIRNNLGVLLTRLGDWSAAEANLQEAMRLARRMDATARMLHPIECSADLYQLRGDFEGARARFEELRRCAHDIGYSEVEVIGWCGIGITCVLAGEVDAAAEALTAATSILGEQRDWSEGHQAWQMLAARLAAARGDAERALALLRDAQAALGDRDAYAWAQFRLAEGEVTAAADPAAADSVIRDALAVFERLGAGPMCRHAESLLARIGRS